MVPNRTLRVAGIVALVCSTASGQRPSDVRATSADSGLLDNAEAASRVVWSTKFRGT